MSFVIDEDAVRQILERGSKSYTVTASNLRIASAEPAASHLPLGMGIASTTVSSFTLQPQMTPQTRERLFDARRRIEQSGARLLTTEELDNEIAERKGKQTGD
jgi:hypothetical protein